MSSKVGAMVGANRRAWHVSEDPGIREAIATLPRASIRLLVGHLNKEVNQGGLLRLAEAFRLE